MSARAVVFDFYGTLTAQRTLADQLAARADQAASLGVDVDRFDAELTATVHERFAGAGGDLPGSMAWVAARCGVTVPPAVLERAATIRLATERTFGRPRREAVTVVTELRSRGLAIGLISDCSAELPLYFPDLPIAPLVDVPVFSFVTGHTKPAPENYLACCAGLGVDPSECLYVGDGGSNELAGARAVGMRAVHLAVPDEVDGLVYGKHDSWDGDTITSLEGVLDLV